MIDSKQFGDVVLKESLTKQFADGLGVFALRGFKEGETVIQWNLKVLTEEEYQKLPEEERKEFCHKRKGILYLYPEPERHVNRAKKPNVYPDFEKQADIALKDIKKGEEITILDTTKEDF